MGFRTCKYRMGDNGVVESNVFDSDAIPDGWVDSPADLSNGADPVKVPDNPTPPAENKKFKRKGK